MDQQVDLKRGRREKGRLQDPSISRLPPHSVEGEQGVLGCIMLSPLECLPETVEAIGETPEPFYDVRHKAVYEVLVEMFDKAERIDLITLQVRLKNRNQLEAVGGLAYLSSLPDTVPSAANLPHYLEIVQKKWTLRKLIRTCTETVGKAYESEDEVDELVDEFERDALRIRGNVSNANQRPTKELVHEAIQNIDNLHAKGIIDGLATGFIDLDKMTGGLHPGEMAILAGYPSSGKSSMAMNIAENACLELKQAVGVFSLEMTAVQLVTRFICSHARVNMRNVREGFLAERDFPKLTNAAGRISKTAIYFDDSNDLSIFRLRAKARRMCQQHKIKLLIVDYLQLLNAIGGSRKTENRQQEVADISSGLKSMAKELQLPVLVLSQLNDDGKLRESRAPAHDADHLWKLKRPENKGNGDCDTYPVDLFIEKNRNGPRDVTVHLTFMSQFTRFESAAKIVESDFPQDTMI